MKISANKLLNIVFRQLRLYHLLRLRRISQNFGFLVLRYLGGPLPRSQPTLNSKRVEFRLFHRGDGPSMVVLLNPTVREVEELQGASSVKEIYIVESGGGGLKIDSSKSREQLVVVNGKVQYLAKGGEIQLRVTEEPILENFLVSRGEQQLKFVSLGLENIDLIEKSPLIPLASLGLNFISLTLNIQSSAVSYDLLVDSVGGISKSQ